MYVLKIPFSTKCRWRLGRRVCDDSSESVVQYLVEARYADEGKIGSGPMLSIVQLSITP